MNPFTLSSLLPYLLLGQASPAEPPTSPPTPPAEEEPAPSALESLVSRLKVEGGADVYYGYNFNRPADGANFIPGTGTTAKRDNEFSLNLASLGVSLEPEPVGLRVLVGVGTAMEVVHAAEPVGTAIGPDVWRFLQQASLSYAHGPLTLEAGVYPSHIGLESLPVPAQLDVHALVDGRAVALLPDGSQGHLEVLRRLERSAAPAQRLADASARTTGARRWARRWPTRASGSPPPSTPSSARRAREAATGLRLFGDLVATYKVTDAFSVSGTADVGTQRRPGQDAALWYAAGLNARVQVARPVAVVARAEFFNDRDGLISGTAQRLAEGTVTLEVKPAEHLVLKLEARHDRSTADVFGGSETTAEGTPVPRSTQTLVVAGATAYF